jgi:hypothetical protein
MEIKNLRSGTEGPSHDPYGYKAFDLVTQKGSFHIHAGLVLKVTNLKTNETTYPPEINDVCKLVGLTREEYDQTVDQVNHFSDICPHCKGDNLEEVEGYPGETLVICKDCKKVVDSSQNMDAIK